MPWTRKTLTEIVQQIEDDIKLGLSISGFGEVDFSFRRSVLKVTSRSYAGGLHELYGKLAWMMRQIFPDTAEGPFLERWATIWGIYRTQAVEASGEVTVLVTSAPKTISTGDIVARADGTEYAATESTVISGSSDDIEVEAVVGGADGDCDTGTTLTFQSPQAGVNPEVTVVSPGIIGGTDTETDAALLYRLLARIKQPPHGGAQFDYVNWALEYAGVTRAWCLPLAEGLGTVGLAFVMDEKTTSPDLVRVGNFSTDSAYWSKAACWTIGSGIATSDGTSGDLSQDINATATRTYRVKFDYAWTSGTLTPKIGSATGTPITSGAATSFDEEIVAAGDGILYFTSASYNGTIDNVEVLDETNTIVPDIETLDAVKAYIEDTSYPPPPSGKKPVTADLVMIRLDALVRDFTVEILSHTGAESDVETAIEANLEDLVYREGVPSMETAAGELLLTHIAEAISGADGEVDHDLTVPSADVVIENDEILIMGTVTWT